MHNIYALKCQIATKMEMKTRNLVQPEEKGKKKGELGGGRGRFGWLEIYIEIPLPFSTVTPFQSLPTSRKLI